MADRETEKIIIGVVSDTHGDLPEDLARALDGVDMIIHAGDFDIPEVFNKLEKIAPVKAVRGNMDKHPSMFALPFDEMFEAGGVWIYILHDLLHLTIDPQAAGVQVLIHGHLHVPEIRQRQGVLYINPGSPTSPRRGSRAGYVRLTIQNQTAQAEWVSLG